MIDNEILSFFVLNKYLYYFKNSPRNAFYSQTIRIYYKPVSASFSKICSNIFCGVANIPNLIRKMTYRSESGY